MANRTYLCSSNSSSLYPSTTESGYDSKTQTIAMDVYAIPLFWLAAFRESDLKTQTIEDDEGELVTVTSALCSTEAALQNLSNAIPALQIAFPEQDDLTDYAQLLGQAISTTGFSNLTMEISELESMDAPHAFQTALRSCLRGFADPYMKVKYERRRSLLDRLSGKRKFGEKDWRYFLLRITDLRGEQKFPEASVFLNGRNFTDDEGWNHCRLLGDSLYRRVPWFPSPKK